MTMTRRRPTRRRTPRNRWPHALARNRRRRARRDGRLPARGRARAYALGNRGPIRYTRTDGSIRTSSTRTGAAALRVRGVLSKEELAEIETDIRGILAACR
jgi:hypothetical protein